MCWKVQVLKTNWFTLQATSVTVSNVTEKLSATTPLSNIGKTCLQLLDRNFPPIIDYIRLSIGTLWKLVIQESKKSQHLNPKTCDCLVAENCLLILNYKQSAVIYRADVTPKIGNQHSYIWLT